MTQIQTKPNGPWIPVHLRMSEAQVSKEIKKFQTDPDGITITMFLENGKNVKKRIYGAKTSTVLYHYARGVS